MLSFKARNKIVIAGFCFMVVVSAARCAVSVSLLLEIAETVPRQFMGPGAALRAQRILFGKAAAKVLIPSDRIEILLVCRPRHERNRADVDYGYE